MMYNDMSGCPQSSPLNVFGYLCLNRRDEILRYLLSGVTNNRNELTSIHVTRLFQLLVQLDFDRVALTGYDLAAPALLLRALPKPGVADLMCTWGSTLLPGALIDSLRQTSWVSLLTL